jgi:hypothetical protein
MSMKLRNKSGIERWDRRTSLLLLHRRHLGILIMTFPLLGRAQLVGATLSRSLLAGV